MTNPHEYTIYYSPVAAQGSGEVTYNRHHINAAISRALNLLKQGEHVGEDKFPHAIKKAWLDTHNHAHPPLFVFPVLHDGVYDGSSPVGGDRVVFGSVTKDYKTADYVAIVDGTHSPPHVFPDLSVNADHKTAHHFKTVSLPEGESHTPLMPPEGRVLLGHDDVKAAYKEY